MFKLTKANLTFVINERRARYEILLAEKLTTPGQNKTK